MWALFKVLLQKNYIIFILFVVISFSLYFPVTHFQFVNLDDTTYMQKSFDFMQNVSNIPLVFLHNQWYPTGEPSLYYRPLSEVLYMSDAYFCGYDSPGCYHISNIFLETIFVFLLFIFLQKFAISRKISFLLSLLFLVNPANTSVIAWIIGDNDSLLGIFFLLSFIYFIDFIKATKRKYLIFHVLLLLAALFTKETALAIFPLSLLYIALLAKKPVFQKKYYFLYCLWVIVGIIWFGGRTIALMSVSSNTLGIINLDSAISFFTFFSKFVPISLFLYAPVSLSYAWIGIIVLFLMLLTIFIVSKKKELIFALLWITCISIPSTVWSDSAVKPIFLEHRVFLPLVGFVLFIGFLLQHVKRAYVKNILLVASILLLTYITYQRLYYFKDSFTFWQRANKESPTVNSYFGLAYAYQFSKNDANNALPLYKKALALNPRMQYVRVDMAIIAINRMQYETARALLSDELQMQQSDVAWLQMGRVYFAKNQYKDAIQAWTKAYAFNSHFYPITLNLALVYDRIGDYKKAKLFYDKTLQLSHFSSEDVQYVRLLQLKYGSYTLQ